MRFYNIKCKGCGAYLNDNPEELGYVSSFTINKTIYCQRCFCIKHYNIVNVCNKQQEVIEDTLNQLDLSKANIFIILDVLDLKNSLIEQYKTNANVIYLINKIDLLPNNHHSEITRKNIINNLKMFNYQFKSIFFCSVNVVNSIRKINDYIKKSQCKKNIFIGKSNVGKSSIIKALCKLNKINSLLLVSDYLNTTNNINQIKTKDMQLIDTPGYINQKSILNFIQPKKIKKIIYHSINHPRNYQIYENRIFKIENLLSIFFFVNEKRTNVTFYTNDKLNILNTKAKLPLKLNSLPNNISYIDNIDFETIEFNNFNSERNKINLVISGLGIISFRNLQKIVILKPKELECCILPYQII